ncbi:hypothetical protein QE152_g29158 [Popillia japonica]|uniref:Reverse transcriptase domain-containing protein n=1 Tax=Popillia japonica TaxID=7064 RepID=A0AAW1JIP4_POPJA
MPQLWKLLAQEWQRNMPGKTCNFPFLWENRSFCKGCSVNLINLNTFKKIPSGRLTKGDTTVFPYNSSTKLPIVGKFMGTFEHNNAKTEAEVFLIKGEAEPLLSYQTSKQLKLGNLALNNRQHIHTSFVESKYPNLFKCVGNLTNHEVNLHINQQIKPVTQTYRRIPFSIREKVTNIREKVEEEVKRLKPEDIIEDAVGPTTSPIVLVPRAHDPESIRLCVDMRAANNAIERERYVSPTVDDILSQLNGAKVFSKLDLKEGYHQLTLNEQSRQITTFATHIGLFREDQLVRFPLRIFNKAVSLFQTAVSLKKKAIGLGKRKYCNDFQVKKWNEIEEFEDPK